jgi:hypothetical protein
MWRARADVVEDVYVPHELPPEFVTILAGVIEGGGGIEITVGGRVVRVPPRQPVTDALKLLLVAHVGSTIGGEVGLGLQTAAVDAVRQIALEEGNEGRDLLEALGVRIERR